MTIASDVETPPGPPRNLDRPVCALDLLYTAKKHQRCIGCHDRAELERIHLREVRHAYPLAAKTAPEVGDIVAATCEVEHVRGRELDRQRHRPPCRVSLVGVHDRGVPPQQRRKIGNARETMNQVGPEIPDDLSQGQGIAQGIGLRQRTGTGPGMEHVRRTLRTGLRHETKLERPRARRRRTSPSTILSVPP